MSEVILMDDMKADLLLRGDVYVMRLSADYDSPSEKDIERIDAYWAKHMPGTKLVVIPPGTEVSLLSPYAFTETLGEYTRTVHFATHAELMAYIAALPSEVKS